MKRSPATRQMQAQPASWVIITKTGQAVCEIFDGNLVKALDTEKYKAVPIIDYLAALNRHEKDKAQ